MIYSTSYLSLLGKITIASEQSKLIGLWIEGQKYYLENIKKQIKENH